MKKILVILAFALIPSFLYATMSNTMTVGATMNCRIGLSMSQNQMMRFPTYVAGMTPSSVNSEGNSFINGGLNGQDGIITIGGSPYEYVTLTVCQTGSSGGTCASGSSGTGGAGHLTNGTTSYDVTYTAVTPSSWTNISLGGSGSVNVTIKGTISATSNAFTQGAYAGMATCTATYN